MGQAWKGGSGSNTGQLSSQTMPYHASESSSSSTVEKVKSTRVADSPAPTPVKDKVAKLSQVADDQASTDEFSIPAANNRRSFNRKLCPNGNCTSAIYLGGFSDGVHCGKMSPFLGYMGVGIALCCSVFGAAYGTVKTGIAVSTIGVNRPDLTTRGIIPIVMAELLAIYGLIVSVIISGQIANSRPGPSTWDTEDMRWAPGAQMVSSGSRYSTFQGYAHLAAGCCCGFSGMVAGIAIGTVGEAGVRAYGNQDRLFVVLILILIFAEALGLYGLIVALILSQKGNSVVCV